MTVLLLIVIGALIACKAVVMAAGMVEHKRNHSELSDALAKCRMVMFVTFTSRERVQIFSWRYQSVMKWIRLLLMTQHLTGTPEHRCLGLDGMILDRRAKYKL